MSEPPNDEPVEVELGKLLVLLTIAVGTFVLMAIDRLDTVAGVGILGMIVGYVTGNGRLAAKKAMNVPMLGRRPRPPGDDQ